MTTVASPLKVAESVGSRQRWNSLVKARVGRQSPQQQQQQQQPLSQRTQRLALAQILVQTV
jgi:hypothetical protein